ncbi:MAG: hypothetical protein ACXVEE_07840 [Polyangiales bacterium]
MRAFSLAALLVCASSCSQKDPAPPAGDDDAATDSATDVQDDAPAAPACITSPAPAPFPEGDCTAPKPAAKDAFDEALGLVGLDRCTFGFDPKNVPESGWDLKDPRRLPDYEALLLHPLRIPGYGRETAKWLDEAVASDMPVSRALAAASIRRGGKIDACPEGTWFVVAEADDAPLATAIVAGANEVGGALDDGTVRAAVSAVPRDLQTALAPIVRALAHAHVEVLAARATTDTKLINQLNAFSSWVIGSKNIKLDAAFLGALDKVDVGRMTTAAVHLSTAIELGKLERFAGTDLPNVEIDTPFGALVLHGKKADSYLPGSKADGAALVLDTGGDDTWRVAAGGASLARPVSVAIDLGGKDLWAYVEKPTADDTGGVRLPSDGLARIAGRTGSRITRQGAGALGIGLLFDRGTGDDTYRSLAVSQGTGVLGVGVLFDEGGNDSYTAETLAQGAASYGVGLLLDRAGDDKYVGYSEMQGFGFTQGVGAIVDLAGKDSYFVDPGDPALGGDPLYYSPQLPDKGNTSMSQGCGMGRRSDTTPEMIGFLGGLGILRDKAGDDTYTASVFAQGGAFLGFGMLMDGAGDDTYEGLWYVQGAAAHMGIAFFHDAAGNDKYNPTFPIAATSIGVGHDFSSVIHLDEGGDDSYKGPNLAIGAGYANGLGVLVNVGGADTFNPKGNLSLGGAEAGEVFMSPRGKLPTYGVFVKAGGTSTYVLDGGGSASSGGSWSFAPENLGDAGPSDAAFVDGPAKSVGVDRPTGTASLP